MSYQEIQAVPADVVKYLFVDGEPIPESVKWSGEGEIPEIGQEVSIRINRIGRAIVVGYAIVDGWLAVRAYPLNPPEWWVSQNGKPGPNNASCAFGAEIGL